MTMSVRADASGTHGALQIGGTDRFLLYNTGNATIGGTLLMGSSFSCRNKIINGNFDFWQRGISSGSLAAPLASYYLTDRWSATTNGTGGIGTITQQAFTPGQTAVPGEPTYFNRWQVTSASSGQSTGGCYFEQRIEDVRTLAGKTITVSLYMQGSGTLPLVYFTQIFGTGGSVQVSTNCSTNVVLQPTWTKYVYTVTLPSITGKTIGANNYLSFGMTVPINTTFTFDIAQVQVEEGSVATPYEPRPVGIELVECQRYCETGYIGFIGNGYAINATVGQFFQFNTTKRTTPTITVGTPIQNSNVGAITIGLNSPSGFRVYAATTAAVLIAAYTNTFVAECEL